MPWLLAVLTALTVARLARLVTDDDLTSPIRAWVVRRAGADSRWTTLVTCPWCISVWIAIPAGFIVVWWPTNRVILAGLLALSASMVTGLLARWSA